MSVLLDTYSKQRVYLIQNGILRPLPPTALDQIADKVDFNALARVKRTLKIERGNLELLPNDKVIQDYIAKLCTRYAKR